MMNFKNVNDMHTHIKKKPIRPQQSEWPLGKMLQKINGEGSVEKCVPSVVRGGM